MCDRKLQEKFIRNKLLFMYLYGLTASILVIFSKSFNILNLFWILCFQVFFSVTVFKAKFCFYGSNITESLRILSLWMDFWIPVLLLKAIFSLWSNCFFSFFIFLKVFCIYHLLLFFSPWTFLLSFMHCLRNWKLIF